MCKSWKWIRETMSIRREGQGHTWILGVRQGRKAKKDDESEKSGRWEENQMSTAWKQRTVVVIRRKLWQKHPTSQVDHGKH